MQVWSLKRKSWLRKCWISSRRRREGFWTSVLLVASVLPTLSLSSSLLSFLLVHSALHTGYSNAQEYALLLQMLSASSPPVFDFQSTFHFSVSSLVKDKATSRAWHFNWSSCESTFFQLRFGSRLRRISDPRRDLCLNRSGGKANMEKEQTRVLLKKTNCLFRSTSLLWNQLTGRSNAVEES